MVHAGPPNKALLFAWERPVRPWVPQDTLGRQKPTEGEQQMYMNQLTIIGFTGQDADFHYTPNGTAVTTLSVATKESWKNDKDEWQSRTDWHRVVVFGKLAEYAKTLVKGSHVMVQGPLRSREYEKNGVKHRIFELRADTIAKLDRAERREEPDSGAFDS
jgi:single-strand DNA-binding protein